MFWIFSQAVKSAARWKTSEPSSRLLIEECHLVQQCEELALRYIPSGIHRVYVADTKRAVLSFHFLYLFKEEAVDTLCNLVFEITHAEMPEALFHHLPAVTLNF